MNIREILHNEATLQYELLMTPVYLIPIQLQGSRMEKLIRSIRQELSKKKFTLKPVFYLSDEFGCVQNTINIGIPFYMAHSELEKLNQSFGSEKHQTLTDFQIKALLRHECGHAFFYAYEIYKNRQAQNLFGNFSAKRIPLERINWTPDECVDYIEKREVATIGYTRTHPEEDFSNTFAAWLDSQENQTSYTGKALQKLQFIDRLIHRYRGRKSKAASKEFHKPYESLRDPLAIFFEKHFGPFDLESIHQKATGFIDDHLRHAFSSYTSKLAASTFLERNKRRLYKKMKDRSKKKSWIRPLIEKSIDRSKALCLYVPGGNSQKALKIFSATLSLMITLIEENQRIG